MWVWADFLEIVGSNLELGGKSERESSNVARDFCMKISKDYYIFSRTGDYRLKFKLFIWKVYQEEGFEVQAGSIDSLKEWTEPEGSFRL